MRMEEFIQSVGRREGIECAIRMEQALKAPGPSFYKSLNVEIANSEVEEPQRKGGSNASE